MARKRSAAGRKRTESVQTNIYKQVEKVNKQLRNLRKSGELGSYASKRIIRMANEGRQFSYKRKRRNIIMIKKSSKFNEFETRQVAKRFREFLGSKLSKSSEIKRTRAETKRKVKERLQGLADEVLTNRDIDEFYELTHDKDFRYLADKISDSDVYVLLREVRQTGGSEEDLIDKLQQFMIFSNSSDAYNKAKNLFDKWVK